MIFIFVGGFFFIFTVGYWIIFFYLGVKYNSMFLQSKNIENLDKIYRMPFRKEENKENHDTEFDPNLNYNNFNKKKEEENNENNKNKIDENVGMYREENNSEKNKDYEDNKISGKNKENLTKYQQVDLVENNKSFDEINFKNNKVDENTSNKEEKFAYNFLKEGTNRAVSPNKQNENNGNVFNIFDQNNIKPKINRRKLIKKSSKIVNKYEHGEERGNKILDDDNNNNKNKKINKYSTENLNDNNFNGIFK